MITIKQIAALAGVSTTTVSNVIHGNVKKVSPANVTKIQTLLKEYGYVEPAGLRRQLHRGSSKLIAVIVNYHAEHGKSPLTDPFYGAVVGAIEMRLRALGYYMMFYSSFEVDDIFQMAMSWDVDGIIAISFSRANCNKLSARIQKPIISIDAFGAAPDDYSIPDVGLDDVDAGYQMGRYLLEKGYENIYFCCGRPTMVQKPLDVESSRWLGLYRAWEEGPYKNTRPKPESRYMGLTPESRRNFNKAILRQLPFKRKTAFVYSSDFTALEAMYIMHENHVRIPEDIGIAGNDDILIAARYITPSLTTIHQDMQMKGTIAANEIISMITKPDYIPNSHTLPVTLVKRSSI